MKITEYGYWLQRTNKPPIELSTILSEPLGKFNPFLIKDQHRILVRTYWRHYFSDINTEIGIDVMLADFCQPDHYFSTEMPISMVLDSIQRDDSNESLLEYVTK